MLLCQRVLLHAPSVIPLDQITQMTGEVSGVNGVRPWLLQALPGQSAFEDCGHSYSSLQITLLAQLMAVLGQYHAIGNYS